MSKPERPRVTDADITRAYEVKERLAFENEWTSDQESEEWERLWKAAEDVYTLLSRMKAWDDLYGPKQ